MSISIVDNFTVDLKFKNKQKYSDDFTYIPIKTESYLQTPKVLIPYGINDEKNTIDIIYLNIDHDKNIKKLINKFNNIYNQVNKKFANYNVHHFLKDKLMRLKLKKYKIYNQHKKEIYKFPNNYYGQLIIYLDGLWMVNNDIWFNWIALQIKIEEPIYLQSYSFIDEKRVVPKPPPPPPPLPPVTKKSVNKIIINKNLNKIDKKTDTIPEISLDEVKDILKNLNRINIFNNI